MAAGQKLRAAFPPGPVQINPVRSLRRFGEFLGGQQPGQPVGAVRAGSRGQQVAPVAYGDQADRVHRAPLWCLARGRVVDAQFVSGEHGAPDLGHCPAGHLLSDQPAREQVGLRLDEKSPGRVARGGPMAFGQRVNHLARGRSERRAEAEHLLAAPRSGGQQGKGLVVVQSGELGPETGQQREPAVSAAFGVDRDAGCGQRLDVAQHGTGGHLQLAGQCVRGQPTALTQQQHQRDQPIGAHARTLSNT
jgi:hypothetical protein